MKILLPTDAFPPRCGGSGWSTFELARGLRARGHEISVVQPRPGTAAGLRIRSYEGFAVEEIGAPAPNLPYLRNYFKNERLYAMLTRALSDRLGHARFDVVHAQHVLTGIPAIRAARRHGVPAVCTVRDYWPVCYWSDLIYSRSTPSLCPACSAGMMTQCVRPRAGSAWPLALPMIPYMRGNLRRKREGLAEADAVIAVSSTMARDLGERAAELDRRRIKIIPNGVDIGALQALAAATARPIAGPYVVYVGKLAPNKGSEHLVEVMRRSGVAWPLAIVGDGPDRAELELQAGRTGLDIRSTGWLDRAEMVGWLAHASIVLFPSRGPESLSRVLIEAAALSRPIAAMDTGGTADIVEHEVSGLLSTTPAGLAADLRRLVDDRALRERLGAGAASHAKRRFTADAVVATVEALYRDLIAARTSRP